MMIKMVVTFAGKNVYYLHILDFVFMEKFYSSILPTFCPSYREVPKDKTTLFTVLQKKLFIHYRNVRKSMLQSNLKML